MIGWLLMAKKAAIPDHPNSDQWTTMQRNCTCGWCKTYYRLFDEAVRLGFGQTVKAESTDG